MKFRSLTLQNFRQFKGESTIHFSTDKEQNITVILGQNGNGKTGIFRAIMFGLYGVKVLPQDNQSQAVELVNWQALQEAEGRDTLATVRIEFEHLENEYTLTRRISARYENGCYIETSIPRESQFKAIELNMIAAGESQSIYDMDEVNRLIKEILPQEMSEFFFFDGEQRSSILNDSELSITEQRNTIKEEIYRMLQIEPLEDARKLVNTLISRKKKELEKNTTNIDLKQKTNEELQLIEQLEQLKLQIEQLEQEQDIAHQELSEKQEILNQNAAAEQLQEKLKDKKELVKLQEKRKKELLRSTKDHIKQMSQLMIFSMLQPEYNALRDLLANEEGRIALDVLKDSLMNHECELCHQSLSIEVERKLQQLIEQYKTKASTDIMQRTIYDMDNFDKQQVEIKEEIQSDFQSLSTIDEDIEKAQQVYQNIQEEFKSLQFDADALYQIRQRVIQLPNIIEGYRTKISQLKVNIEDIETVKLPTLQKEIHELAKADGKTAKMRAILDKLEHLYNILNAIIEDYRQTVIQSLSNQMTTLYKQLINTKDREKLDHIEVTDKFDIHFINHFGYNSRSDNSQGQNQMLSLSFVLALAQYASKGRDELNFPLLIDTPFGRLDKGNRHNLIENIPLLTDQWILLVTDTELSQTELEYFSEGQRVGANYKLVNDVNGTIIEEKESVTQLLKEDR